MKINFTRFIYLLLPVIFLIQCKKDNVVSEKPKEVTEEVVKLDPNKFTAKIDTIIDGQLVTADKVLTKTIIPKKDFTYTAIPYKKNDSLAKDFDKKYTDEEKYSILALNRIDKNHLRYADTIVVPSVVDKDFLRYAPFPGNLPVLKDVKKFVFFSYPVQAFAVYEYGNLIKWGPTSMGKKNTPTEGGLHFANWKKELSISTVSDEWKLRWNFNISNFKGIGWHQYAMPGYPASHSCLRMLEEDAKWMYGFADQWILNKGGATVRANGTPVYVYGDYNWGGRKPWYNLLDNPTANDISVDDMTKIVEPEIAKIIKEQQNRVKVRTDVKAQKALDSPVEKTS